MTTVLVLAHPDLAQSRANRAMADAVQGLPGLDLVDLYALYPDGKVDYETEKTRLLGADRLVLQFPMYWYSTPPLRKAWEDDVLTPLFYLEADAAATTAGLPVLTATTTGNVASNYAAGGSVGLTVDELFAPLRATARRCGWTWRTPHVVHDVRNLDDDALRREGARYRSTVLAMPAKEQLLPVAA